MKRSMINRTIREAMAFFAERNFRLPPFAFYRKDDWEKHLDGAEEIFDLELGWDVTGFGKGDFERFGLTLFTLRNGKAGSARYPKPYAEKIMMVRENQITLRHFHWHKREDIIVRGGGNLVIELFRADPERSAEAGGPFEITVNGMRRQMESGDRLVLAPGESVCLEPVHAHRFYAEPGSGPAMVGEVSAVNDDANDNCFLDDAVRFDPILEDEEPEFLLAADCRRLYGGRSHA
ncbi:D-lyxose/D-mannose family sugar isomerase [bacterium]|nr:D-lyxose/D-mannose family sugar isomerase [bacterium]